MTSVKTCSLNPAELVLRTCAAAKKRGFRIERFGAIDDAPLVGLTKRVTGVRPRIYLSAGVHGDEPAPPWAILRLIESGVFDARANWFLVPMLNPSGFRLNTRHNSADIDLNRDYLDPVSAEVKSHVNWLRHQPRFDLALCLHEDWESNGFYLYELNPQGRPSLAPLIRDGAQEFMPIETAQIIDGRPVDETGIIRPVSDPTLRENWPEAIYLRHHHTNLGYTLETSSAFPIAQRISTQVAAVKTALAEITMPSF